MIVILLRCKREALNIGILDTEKFFNGSDKRRKRKLTAVCSHQTRIGNLDAHLI